MSLSGRVGLVASIVEALVVAIEQYLLVIFNNEHGTEMCIFFFVCVYDYALLMCNLEKGYGK